MESRLTVVHVVPEDSFRGAQVYAGRLRDALADNPEQRHIVLTLFASTAGAMHPDLTIGHRSGLLRRAGLAPRVVANLRRTLRTLNADVVVAHGGEALKYVVAARGSAQVVYYKVGLSSAELARPSRRRLYRLLARRVDLGVGVSTAVRDQMREVLGMPSARLDVIPNGRPSEIYYPADPGAAPRSRPLVLWIGQLEVGKRPELFVEVIEKLRGHGLEFDAAIAGDGPMRQSIETLASRARVELLGVRTDIPELLRSSAVLVMTSAPDTEGMPGVLVEAGLSGVPVVATQAAGVDDVVINGETGFVVEAEAPTTEIANHLATLLSDHHVRASFGQAAHNWCMGEFTIGASAAKWRAVLASMEV